MFSVCIDRYEYVDTEVIIPAEKNISQTVVKDKQAADRLTTDTA